MLIRRTRPVVAPPPRKPLILRRNLPGPSPTDANPYPSASGAVISLCGAYRYSLWRKWGPGRLMTFIMLNPSTADALKPDPTLTRCMQYAKTSGYDGVAIVNLCAFRSASPEDLFLCKDPMGPDNLMHLQRAIRYARTGNVPSHIVCAWGATVRRMPYLFGDSIDMLECHRGPYHMLKMTDSGHPSHPLYLKKELRPVNFDIIAYASMFDFTTMIAVPKQVW